MIFRIFVLSAIFAVVRSAICQLSCPSGTCYGTSQDSLDCLASIPFNQAWANATLDVLIQSMENFGFSALYHSTGPPYSISIDIDAELAATQVMVNQNKFSGDFEFQEHLQNLFQKTIDAHTRYSKPACYNTVFIQPFAFDMRVEVDTLNPASLNNEPKVYLMGNLYTSKYLNVFPQFTNLNDYLDKEISLLNGVEFTTYISSWGDNKEMKSNNRGIRFNSAIRSHQYQSAISYSVLPVVSSDLVYTFTDGSVLSLPWMASYSSGLGSVSKCAAVTSSSISLSSSSSSSSIWVDPSPFEDDPLSQPDSYRHSYSHGEESSSLLISAPSLDDRVLLSTTSSSSLNYYSTSSSSSSFSSSASSASVSSSTSSSVRSDRQIIIPSSNAPYYISCFLQSIPTDTSSSSIYSEDLLKEANLANVKNILVMKVSSFSPPGSNYLDAWEGFLNSAKTCLSFTTDYQLMVVDVMQNGGGYVCLGLRLIELLVEEYNIDKTKVQMNYDLPHSPLMTTYIETINSPEPYPNPQAVEFILNQETQESFIDGKSYYYPGRKVVQGGIENWRTNFFSLDCREAESLPINNWVPPIYLPPDRLLLLSDGTCGSTCASFTKIPQEDGKATLIGVGGIWDEGMDVASFAGGFVCNPDYLANIANWSGVTFPRFLTNQHWQFAWASWYSAKLPSRPTQFTVQDPDYREAFWGFPHSSINSTVTSAMVSSLYDRVIVNGIARLAATATDTSTSSSSSSSSTSNVLHLSDGVAVMLIVLCIVLGALVLYLGYQLKNKKSNELSSSNQYHLMGGDGKSEHSNNPLLK